MVKPSSVKCCTVRFSGDKVFGRKLVKTQDVLNGGKCHPLGKLLKLRK